MSNLIEIAWKVRALAAERERNKYKQALEKIRDLDFRGHPSPEQAIASKALERPSKGTHD